jgi:hypothetical protein
MLIELLKLRDRAVYLVDGTLPAAYYIADQDLKGVLVNAPPFSPALPDALNAIAPLRFPYLPSHGARDLEQCRGAGAEVLACGLDADTHVNAAIARTLDL